MAKPAKSAGHRKALSAVGLTATLLFIAVASTQFLRANAPAISSQGELYQAGRRVGWAAGAHISHDGTTVEFGTIQNAEDLVHNATFDYDGYTLRISQIHQVQYPNAAAAGRSKPQTTLVQVVTKVQRSR